MGTRHLIAVMVDGEYKVAQYGQWDGYPEGQGVSVLEFARGLAEDNDRMLLFLSRLRSAKWLTEETVRKVNAHGDGWQRAWPHLSRDAGSGVLRHVLEHEPGIELKNAIDFTGDSLMCEYAYALDFDKGTFECFKGFNKEPLGDGERFRDAPTRDNEYQPVRHVRSWKLNDLPSDESFLAEMHRLLGEDDD